MTPRRPIFIAAWPYVASACLAAIVAASVLHLWSIEAWKFPLQYSGGDYFFYLACSKTIRQSGWFFGNPLLGAPGAMNLLDYPLCDDLNLLGLRLCNLVTTNFVTALTLFYFLGFPLAALTTTAALRRLSISRPASAAAATLYALAPYHFFREHHVFLAFYIMLPPALAIAIRLAEGEDFSIVDSPGRRKFLKTSAILLAAVSTGIYYAAFTGFFMALGGAIGALRARRPQRLAAPGIFLAVMLAGILLNTAPNLVERVRAGKNPDVAIRLPGESEVYALRLTYLLLPIVDDRIAPLAAVTNKYDTAIYPPGAPASESRISGVGLLTAGGVVFLMCMALIACAGLAPPRPLGTLAAFTVAGFLLATYAGFGAVLAFLVTPMIRSWARMNICLAFFSLVAIGFVLDRFIVSHPGRSPNAGLICALIALLAVSIYEQIPYQYIDRPSITAGWNSDDAFVQKTEQAAGRNAMIFQLPYVAFPESSPVGRMLDYDLFRGYFHSDTLTWSYGAMRGRDADKWQRAVASMPVPQMLGTLRDAKFDGIYIDTWCGLAKLPEWIAQLDAAGLGPRIVSDDHRFLFYPLSPRRP
jgi:phosphoglycerol transferase